jgi:hypothetical protein
MRLYRARKKHALVGLGETPATRAAAEAEIAKPKVDPHLQCDATIARLEAEVRRLKDALAHTPAYGLRAVVEDPHAAGAVVPEELIPEPRRTIRREQKPSFLAAPDDDCVCGHEGHAYHTAAGCSAFIRPKVKCPCKGFMADMGFE